MIPAFIKNWFSGRKSKPTDAPAPVPTPAPPGQSLEIPQTASSEQILRYPPYDTGFEFVSVKKVSDGQKDIITRIARTTGLSPNDFEQRFRPTIENLIRYAHLLPATSTSFFRGEGGLLRMSLEIGLYSLQTANASIFPISGGVERRYYVQPKWCVATFVAGLCSQLYRAASHMAVVTKDGKQWPSITMSLTDWAEGEDVQRYYVRWLEQTHGSNGQAAGAFLINHVVPDELLQWLNEGSNHIVPAMVAAIAGTDASHRDNPVARIVAPIISRVIDDDMTRSPLNYGHLSVGVHLEPHIIDAMRRMVRDGKWAANRDRSPLWAGADGTYLRWNLAATDIVTFLNTDGFGGVPKDPDTLAEILLRAGVAQRKTQQSPYWSIVLPVDGEIVDGTLKLTQNDFLFTDEHQIPADRSFTLGLSQASRPQKRAAGAPASDDDSQFQLSLGEVPPSAEPPPTDEPPQKERPKRAPRAKTPTPTPEAPPADDVPPLGTSIPPTAPTAAPTPGPSGDGPVEPKRAGRDLMGMLKKESAWFLNEIITAKRENKLVGVIMWLPDGLGISMDELNAHGIQPKDLMEELHTKQWLWVDTTKPMRHIHNRKIGEEAYRFLIIKPEVARELGFPEEVASAS